MGSPFISAGTNATASKIKPTASIERPKCSPDIPDVGTLGDRRYQIVKSTPIPNMAKICITKNIVGSCASGLNGTCARDVVRTPIINVAM